MAYTSVLDKMEISEDSGCVSQNTIETASALFNNSCLSASCIDRLYSPLTSNVTSLKKAQYSERKLPSSQQTKIDSPENISYASPWLLGSTPNNLLSSTFNESLSTNFEKFVLNSTPNYYVERSDFAEKPKANYNPEPSTPIKHSDHPRKPDYLKYCSTIKLGSPERNEILYGDSKRLDFLHKPKTPQKFYDRTKRYSPAKKRLFGMLRKPTKVDPINFFLNDKRQFPNIVSNILSYVSDSDLCSFKMVSKKWFSALENDKASYSKYLAFIKSRTFDKENKYEWKNDSLNGSSPFESPVKTPVSPRRRKFNDFMETVEMLTENQTLNKCPNCQWAAIVEKNISQCQRDACGYIHCTKCNSFSTKGPEHFIDHCQMSALKVEKPCYRPRLTDSPPSRMETTDELPSFFQDDSFNNNYATKCDSSGYSTDGEFYPYYKPNNSKESFGVLQECNRELVNSRRSRERRSSVAAVIPLHKTKIHELMEPSSPPQIKNVACSKQSKKSLKRLLH